MDPGDGRLVEAKVVVPDGYYLFDFVALSKECAPHYMVEGLRVRGLNLLAFPMSGRLFVLSSPDNGLFVSLGSLTDVCVRVGDVIVVSARHCDAHPSVRLAGVVSLRECSRASDDLVLGTQGDDDRGGKS